MSLKDKLPLVYVIVLNWNRKNEVLAAVRSLHRLRYPNFVPLVVDNASKDQSVHALKTEFKEVKVLVTNRNLGYSGGNNLGIEYALSHGADFVLLMNNDARANRFLIDRLMSVMQSDEKIAVVGPKNLQETNPNWVWGAWGTLTYGPYLTEVAGRNQLDGPEYSGTKDVEVVIGCGYMWRREALEDIGLLDTNFFGYHEDVDWCLRARKRGWRVVYCGDAVIYHKGAVSANKHYSCAMPAKYFLGRNAILVAKKHGQAQDILRILLNSFSGSVKRFHHAKRRKILLNERQFIRGIVDW